MSMNCLSNCFSHALHHFFPFLGGGLSWFIISVVIFLQFSQASNTAPGTGTAGSATHSAPEGGPPDAATVTVPKAAGPGAPSFLVTGFSASTPPLLSPFFSRMGENCFIRFWFSDLNRRYAPFCENHRLRKYRCENHQ